MIQSIALEKNVAGRVTFGLRTIATPGAYLTGVTTTITGYYKDGAGAWTSANPADQGAEIGSTGIYSAALTAAELNHEYLMLKVTGALAEDEVIIIQTNGFAANLNFINSLGTSGNNATLNLKQLNIQNSAGVAMIVATSNATSSAATFQGNTTGHGILTTGGATSGAGLRSVGGGTGSGAVFTSGSGATGDGVQMTAASSAGNGLKTTGTTTGHGLYAVGGNNAGAAGMMAYAGDGGIGFWARGSGSSATGTGMYIQGGGATASKGLHILGQGTDEAVYLSSAATNGTIYAQCTSTAGPAMSLLGNGTNNPALKLTGRGTGAGILSTGGATAEGLKLVGGATSGSGLSVASSGGGSSAASFVGVTSGYGMAILGGAGQNGLAVAVASGNADAVSLVGSGTGSGLSSTGGATGSGAKFVGGATSGAGLLAQGTASNANAATFTPHGTGYGISALPALLGGDLLTAISGIGTAGGAAINVDPATDNAAGGISGVTSGTTKVGTETGTFANVSNVNGVYHTITHAANAIDWVYQMLTGGGTSPVSVTWVGYLTSANDTITFYAWNHVGAAWEIIGTQVGTALTTNTTKTMTLYARHSGTSAAELGKVYIRAACTGMTSPVLNTDQLYVSYAVTSRTVGYASGAVWVDTVAGTAGTESYVNGTADKPSLTLADATTIATAVGLGAFEIGNGSTIAMPVAGYTGRSFRGDNWILQLANRTLNECFFEGAETSGIVNAATTGIHFEHCDFVAATTLTTGTVVNSCFGSTTTLGAAGDYLFKDCCSHVAGSGTPIFDFNSVAAITCSFRRWSGGIKLTNLAADSVVSIDVVSGGTVTLEGNAGATVNIRGMVSSVVNTAGCTVNTNAVINRANLDAWQLAGGVASVTGAVGSVTGLTPSTVSTAVWTEALPGAFGAGTAGYNLDSQVSAAGGGGTVDANLVSIDGLTTTDGAAILNLRQLNVVTTADEVAVTVMSGGSSAGAYVGGGGDGLRIDAGLAAGATGAALNVNGAPLGVAAFFGGASGLGGQVVLGSTENGIEATAKSGTNASGLALAGAGSGHGATLDGGDTGNGARISGGLSGGEGLLVRGVAANADAVLLDAHGSGADLRAAIVGNITGNLSGSVGSVTGAVGSVTGAVGSVTGSVGSVAAGGITAASIATDAIDADALAADAVAEIAAAITTDTAAITAAVWGETLPGAYPAGTAGYYLDAQVSDPSTGPGALQVTLHTQDSTTAVVDDVHLAVYDATNTTLLARTNSDTGGDGNVNLDVGTYKVRPYKSGYEYDSPQTIVVAAAGQQVITLDAVVIPVSVDPDKCMVSGYLRDAGGAALVGVEITFSATVPDSNSGGMLANNEVLATTDSNGLFSVELAREALVFVQCPEAGLELTMTVPDAASVDWVDWYDDEV